MLNKIISAYLINSYIYYELGTQVVSDNQFDELCSYLLERYEEVEVSDHPHKHLITKERLTSTTAYDISNYPEVVKGCAREIIRGRKQST